MAASFCGADHAHDGGCSFSCLGMKGRSQIHKFTHVSSSVFIHDVTAKQVESKVLNFFEDLAGSDNIFLFLAGLDCYVVANPCGGRGTTVVTRARHFTPIAFYGHVLPASRPATLPRTHIAILDYTWLQPICRSCNIHRLQPSQGIKEGNRKVNI